jgi:carboxyl-terminal processing protease
MPKDWEQRPYRDSHVGVQLHRKGGEIRIEAVIWRSPAEEVGLKIGDAIVAVDGKGSDEFDVVSMLRYFEGRPGTQVDITIRRDGHTRMFMVVRRDLF